MKLQYVLFCTMVQYVLSDIGSIELNADALVEPRTVMESDMDIVSPSEWMEDLSFENTAEEKMTVYFMMKHHEDRVLELEHYLYSISDPESEAYGKHLSVDQLTEMLHIPSDNLKLVTDFLESYDVSYNVNRNKDIISVTVPVDTAKKMFQTEISAFRHNVHDATLFRATKPYSLPRAVGEVVSMVGDLVLLPSLHRIINTGLRETYGAWSNDCTGLPACAGKVTPGVCKQRYKISSDTNGQGGMAVAEFQGQYFDHADLKKFSSGCSVNVTVDNIIGGNSERAGVESLLDIEYIKALAPEIPLTVIYASQYSLMKWATSITNDDKTPKIHSVSYGNDEKQQMSDAYIFSVNTQLMKAGARGLSILFASGDQGVCGREGCGLIFQSFKPDFPAGSPYVTAVGGTDFLGNAIGEETSWSQSGGGFSNHFSIPNYQKDAVDGYFKSPDADLPPANLWNRTGRGYPDVSALGGQKNPYCVVTNGFAAGVAGTSASCPVVAAIFAKLNSARLAANKPVLGFLNPFIYKNAAAFQDVTHGSNPGTGFRGFKAIKGWDPATGVGTPDYSKLLEIVQSMEN